MKNLYNTLLLKQLYQLKNLGFNYTSAKPFSYDDTDRLELSNSLSELKKQASNCHLCSLSKSRNRTVFGEGDQKATIMFIGDMPLEMENEVGQIALGNSGKMLTAMVENVLKLSFSNIYMTNLLKCHPPATQKELESAFHTCKAYLFKEIEIVKPKIIVTLGKEAYHYLTNDTTPLKEVRGRVIERDGYSIVPTYHPNFLLKNPSFKKEVFRDLKRVREMF